MIHYQRNARFTNIGDNKNDFVEVTMWYSDTGFDAVINSNNRNQMLSLSFDEFNTLAALIKDRK
jgi:hypothetical protein